MRVILRKPVFDHPDKGRVVALLNSAPEANLTFDQIRILLDDVTLPDGVIHQIAIDAGFEVEDV